MLPLGGIGTGTISLNGRGGLRDFEIYDRPAKNFTPPECFVALHVQQAGKPSVTRALEGAIPNEQFEGPVGSRVPDSGLPRFRHVEFGAAYPLGQVLLSDPDVPVEARLEAFNPLIPADADSSGLPVAVLRYVIRNKTARAAHVTVAATLPNFIGHGEKPAHEFLNRNTFKSQDGIQGLLLETGCGDRLSHRWGTMALATLNRTGVTHRTSWRSDQWQTGLLDFWDDLSSDGRLDPAIGEKMAVPKASLAVRQTIPPKSEKSFVFLIVWHFPNRRTWTPEQDLDALEPSKRDPANNIGNYYATRFRNAWHVATDVGRRLPELERRTLAFVGAFETSDLPVAVKEAALFNLSTLRTQTVFRAADGNLFGWEGCHDDRGSCPGSCTHVWNYEHATGFLFGKIAWTMRQMEFLHMTDDAGHMSFRISLPLTGKTRSWGLAAADGQMGAIMRLYREWKLSGDDESLKSLYLHAKKALEFCWIPGGWDADRDGVMEGCQHNTMDVEYYGPNPQMTGWYLGALRAMEELARHVGDNDFAQICRQLFQKGSSWMDQHLFNGDYYEHQIVPAKSVDSIAGGLRHSHMGTRNLANPDFQLGSGCLIDQLVGQYTAHVCGLGYLHQPSHVKKTLESIRRYNWQETVFNHFNHLRSFVLNDESALLMCTYPKGRRPEVPFPYYNEVMTGFEYTAAVGLLFEGMVEQGLSVIRAIRRRYDGARRSPFDEAECGHHYARAMASWAAVIACTGFQYDASTGVMQFAAPAKNHVRHFWSTGYAWGVVDIQKQNQSCRVVLQVMEGSVDLAEIRIGAVRAAFDMRDFRGGQTIRKNCHLESARI